MQATKDTFYLTLRDRLALADPARTITVDGVTRPAIVVVENDKPSVTARQQDAFYLEWGAARVVRPAISTLMAALFVVTGGTGGRACFYYPRLQAAASTSELREEVEASLFCAMLHANLRAMPSVDPNDGETVLCYRSYFPARTAKV